MNGILNKLFDIHIGAIHISEDIPKQLFNKYNVLTNVDFKDISSRRKHVLIDAFLSTLSAKEIQSFSDFIDKVTYQKVTWNGELKVAPRSEPYIPLAASEVKTLKRIARQGEYDYDEGWFMGHSSNRKLAKRTLAHLNEHLAMLDGLEKANLKHSNCPFRHPLLDKFDDYIDRAISLFSELEKLQYKPEYFSKISTFELLNKDKARESYLYAVEIWPGRTPKAKDVDKWTLKEAEAEVLRILKDLRDEDCKEFLYDIYLAYVYAPRDIVKQRLEMAADENPSKAIYYNNMIGLLPFILK